ncbi:MAG: FAD-binding oxidoreductase [Alphaproteobacteria bacterium]|nr:FAD-binding oxidoreductase [Alphaproteobacteria bacterium]
MTASAPPDPDDLVSTLRARLGAAGVLTDADTTARYLVDWRGMYRGPALCVARPATTDEVSFVVAQCARRAIAIVPQGGNTGLVGGSVPRPEDRCVLLSLERMNRIRAIEPLDFTLTAEAGCVLQAIQKAADDADRFFPLSLAAEGSCQIGGNLSTNAGGIQVLRFGMARDLVLGLEVVLPDGTIWNGLNGLRKDNTGYDLKQLFIGSEGTLGIITAAVLKLFPKPRAIETAFIAVRDPVAAIELLSRMRAGTGDAITAFELIDRNILDLVFANVPGNSDPLGATYGWYVLTEAFGADTGDGLRKAFEGVLETALEDGLVLDAAFARSGAQRQAFWKIREDMADAQKHEGVPIRHDVAVAVSRVPEFLDRAIPACRAALPGARVIAFGHAGDGNIHFNLLPPKGGDSKAFQTEIPRMNRVVHDIVTEMGGSISAEHGIGRLRRDELAHYKAPAAMALMRTLKAALDPRNLLNPGKIV